MKNDTFDFYSNTVLKSYNLDSSMRYQLNMLDSLDVFTRKHSENVASLTCRLCEYLHLNKNFTIYCTTCAYLHDIGKLFIPSNILQKNGPLTDEEYRIMKTHTTIGYEMCFKDLKLRPYCAGPLYHHEALNGTGYPNGLHAKDIPLEGQIIRVADEFDAITSKRQYKTHIGITDTLKILIENSKPNEKISNDNALAQMAEDAKLGKINKHILKCLFKVIIDDTEYEISQNFDYVDYLNVEIKRLKEIDKYHEKMLKEKTEKKQEYYKEGMRILFAQR
ncbi:MAG: HD domain-containing protein [Clostridia bacterium]|nr:HD domain-containing protein [Clostridia bacterium]